MTALDPITNAVATAAEIIWQRMEDEMRADEAVASALARASYAPYEPLSDSLNWLAGVDDSHKQPKGKQVK